MKTERVTDDTDLPRVRTAFAQLFMRPAPPVVPDGVDVFVPASDRYYEAEILRVAAFCAVWSFAATGCFLPWEGGLGWMMAVRVVVCLAIWLPVWFGSIVLVITLPGAFSLLLGSQGVLSKAEVLALSTAVAVLAFTVAACVLLVSPLLVQQIVGGVWLLALAIEGVLRLILLVRRK